jgi:eukaryotic-like serine/threonine-protein kinase
MAFILASRVGPADDEDHDLFPGRILGPYELLVRVGAGGMARVWAARRRGTQQIFALKMLLPHLKESASFRDMFFDEAHIASRIQHENVCATYELVDLEGHLTLVMEWVDGTSLMHMLRPGANLEDPGPRVPLPLRHAVKIVAETSAGLHAAHELVDERGQPFSVVHRDVSPHNVLVTRDGRVKVTDFGVAKAFGKLHKTIAGQVKGKLAYMSPEQLIGGGVDRRSDVFSLASVLYEATTGQKPFQGEHDPQLMAAIIMGNFDPPSAIVPGYPPALERIVLRAMATEPEARYATALQLRQALEGWLAESGPHIGPPQIAAVVHERCGRELAERALATSPPVPVPSSTPRIDTPMEVGRHVPADPVASTNLFGAFLAVMVGLLGGVAVLFYVHEARRARSMHVTSAMIDASPAPSFVAPLTVPTMDPVDASPYTVVGDRDPLPEIQLMVPEGARIFVDNKELPPGATSVPRPDGGTSAVVVRAEGRNDAILMLDASAPDVIEVKLARKKRALDAGSSEVAMPPNPYD